MSLPSINFLHLTVSEIQPGQTISRRPPAHPDTMGENNTPTALKGCGVKNCDLLPLGSLFLLGLNSAPLSLYLSFLGQTLEGKKRGGATSVGYRLTGELVADPDLSGFSDPRSNGPVQFCFVMSSHKSLAAYPPTKR